MLDCSSVNTLFIVNYTVVVINMGFHTCQLYDVCSLSLKTMLHLIHKIIICISNNEMSHAQF